jgi:invasion protein IalB
MRATLCLALASLAFATIDAEAQSAKFLEKYSDWSTYMSTGSAKVCFAISQPWASKPENAKRGPIYFYVSHWPGDKVRNEISVKIGYPFNEKLKATATIGAEKFELFTKGEGAFVEKADAEAKLVEALRGGGDLIVEGTSQRGTKTSDEYSLNGIVPALDRIEKECAG